MPAESGIRQPLPGTRARTVAFVCGAEILSLTSFSLVPALLPQFIVSWSLSNAEAGCRYDEAPERREWHAEGAALRALCRV
jgi:hypothetical protein